MAVKIASRMSVIQPSPTLAVTAKAAAMKAEGLDIASFGAGEPDFPTPKHICEAAKKAIDDGYTRYTPVPGLLQVRDALATFLADRYGLDYAADEVIVTVGGKHGLFNLFLCLLDPGDEVIIPAPYWVSYPDQVRLAEGVPVILPTTVDADFKITAAQLDAAVTPKTKVLVLNSPSNPTGATYTEDELRAIAEVVIRRDLFVISDEIYSELVYDGFHFKSFPTIMEGLTERTAIASGWSKTYSMTGWRLGWVAGPKPLIGALTKLQSQQTSNVPGMTQMAAMAASQGSHDFLVDWLAAFDRRRRMIVSGLRAIPGVKCPMPTGAFYVFPDFNGILDLKWHGCPMGDGIRLAEYLLTEHLVAVVPGEAFGAPGCARLSYATSDAVIAKGLERIRVAIEALRAS
jgi:aspartate aminotransferase